MSAKLSLLVQHGTADHMLLRDSRGKPHRQTGYDWIVG